MSPSWKNIDHLNPTYLHIYSRRTFEQNISHRSMESRNVHRYHHHHQDSIKIDDNLDIGNSSRSHHTNLLDDHPSLRFIWWSRRAGSINLMLVNKVHNIEILIIIVVIISFQYNVFIIIIIAIDCIVVSEQMNDGKNWNWMERILGRKWEA